MMIPEKVMPITGINSIFLDKKSVRPFDILAHHLLEIIALYKRIIYICLKPYVCQYIL